MQNGVKHATHNIKIFAVAFTFFGAFSLILTTAFLAIYLERDFSMPAALIGMVVGVFTLIGAAFSWLGGSFADRFGIMPSLRITAFLYVIAFALLATTNSIGIIALAVVLLGLIRTVSTPTLKGLFARIDDGTGSVFRIRYISISAAVLTVGILSRIFPTENIRIYFWISAINMIGLFGYCLFVHLAEESEPAQTSQKYAPQSAIPKTALFWSIAFGFFVFFTLSQFETTLPLFLLRQFGEAGAMIYSNEIIVGAFLAVFLGFANHFIQNKIKSANEARLVFIATAIASFSIASIFLARFPWQVYAGAALYVMTEVILMPIMDAIIAPLTHKSNRSRIMGFLEIRQFAFFAGPVTGGYLLDNYQVLLAPWLALMAILVFPSYLFAKRAVHHRLALKS